MKKQILILSVLLVSLTSFSEGISISQNNDFLSESQKVWNTKDFLYETGKGAATGAAGGAIKGGITGGPHGAAVGAAAGLRWWSCYWCRKIYYR
ncbi:hypothetical protein KX935_03905 [Streptobacillus moniliformis]|nr:hypothetical protein KX935_03905 [Streptobacillus moniliformis]